MPVDVRRRVIAAALVGLAVASGAASAHAAYAPRVAVQPDGTAHFGWLEGLPVVAERSWPAGGALTETQAVSGARTPVGQYDMGVDGSGTATFVWVPADDRRDAQARRRRADGSLGPLLEVSAPLYQASDAKVAVAPGGTTVFTWRREGNPSAYAQARRLSPAGVLGPILTLSAAGYRVSEPQVAMDSAGNALVAWIRTHVSSGTDVVQSRFLAADGTVGTVQTLSTSAQAIDSLRVAFDANGAALIGWLRRGEVYIPQVRRRAPSGALSAVQSLTSGGTGASQLQLAVDPAGNAMVAWSRNVEGGSVVQARHRTAGGVLGNVLTLSVAPTPESPRFATGPQVAIDGDDNAIVVWHELNTANEEAGYEVLARRRSAAGAVGPAFYVAFETALDETAPQVAMASDGTATFAWNEGPAGASGGTDSPKIMARRRGPGGTLGPRTWVDGP